MALKLSIHKPTPQLAKNIVNVLLYLSGLWAIIQPQFPDMSEHLVSNINKYLLLGLAATRFTISFFHWEDASKPDTDKP